MRALEIIGMIVVAMLIYRGVVYTFARNKRRNRGVKSNGK